MNAVLCHAFFGGQVQGVGFRFRARQLAEAHGLAGWVKNLPDGRVELEAEGPTGAVEDFLTDLRADLAGYIRQEDVRYAPASGRFPDFSIRY